MLEQLALNHSLWVKMAKSICKDAYLADDLVSEMYLKMSEVDDTKPITSGYIRVVIYNLFMDHLKAEKKYTSIDANYNSCEEQDEVKELEIPNCLTWVEKQILLLRQDKSGRQIGTQYHIHWRKVHRIEAEAKSKLKEWLNQSQDLETSLQQRQSS